jgi:hypothetical protein
MAEFSWRKEYDKFWLDFKHDGMGYEIPFDPESRFIDGLVLTSRPGRLVKGMQDFSAITSPLLERTPELRPVQQEIEKYQAPAILAQGGTLDWTTPEEAYRGDPPFTKVEATGLPVLINTKTSKRRH